MSGVWLNNKVLSAFNTIHKNNQLTNIWSFRNHTVVSLGNHVENSTYSYPMIMYNNTYATKNNKYFGVGENY